MWDRKEDFLQDLVEEAVEDDEWVYIPDFENSRQKGGLYKGIHSKVENALSGNISEFSFEHVDYHGWVMLAYSLENRIKVEGKLIQPIYGYSEIDLEEDDAENVLEAQEQVSSSLTQNYLERNSSTLEVPFHICFEEPVRSEDIWGALGEASYAVKKLNEAYDGLELAILE